MHLLSNKVSVWWSLEPIDDEVSSKTKPVRRALPDHLPRKDKKPTTANGIGAIVAAIFILAVVGIIAEFRRQWTWNHQIPTNSNKSPWPQVNTCWPYPRGAL